MTAKRPMLISLFCGPGGLDEGFKRAGFTTLYAMDKDPAAVDTHILNHPETHAVEDDITTLDTGMLIRELKRRLILKGRQGEAPIGIIGGPPCQSFSYANTNQSEDDLRHSLPTHYARVIRDLRDHGWLDFFVFENVPGLKGLHKEKFDAFKSQFEKAGFVLYEQQLEAWQFGVPQLRPRIFVVGIRKNHPKAQGFQFPTAIIPSLREAQTVRSAIGHLPEPAYFSRDIEPDTLPVHQNHWCMNPKSAKFQDGTFSRSGKFGKSFAVLDWNLPSLTVAYGHREVHIHPTGKRRLSVYEAMLLQGFPPTYRLASTLSDQIRLVSEVVAPPVAFHLARAVGSHLGLALVEDPAENWLTEARIKAIAD